MQMSFHGKILLTLKTDLIRMTSIGSAKSRWRQNPWQFVYICFCFCCRWWLGNQLLIHHTVNERRMCRICHGFRLTNWDDYFWVHLDHFWVKCQFLGRDLASTVLTSLGHAGNKLFSFDLSPVRLWVKPPAFYQ